MKPGLGLVLLLSILIVACAPTSGSPASRAESAADPSATDTRVESPTVPPKATQKTDTAVDPNDTPGFFTGGWKTDFSKHSVLYQEIISGGPPRDGIPPLDQPRFETVSEADAWLTRQEPVILFVENDDARAYPLQILLWHEIVNDVVGGRPVTVTFCPLCNTAIAFDRRLDSVTYDFGTSGLLRNSDLVMWDRQTESLWQQVTGEAIVGVLTGKRLDMVPASIISWSEFKAAYPAGKVLSKDTGHSRPYGSNPYAGYDRVDQSPFLFMGEEDKRLPPMERVVTLSIGHEHVAYPFSALQKAGVIHDRAGGQAVVIFWQAGTNSALDQRVIAASKDIGSGVVFDPNVDGRELTFEHTGDAFQDRETGSTWNIAGQATAGPLKGKQLRPVVHGNHFWFATAAFFPDVRIYGK